MHGYSGASPIFVALLLAFLAALCNGCTRSKYRQQADCEAYEAIAERNTDPRWHANDYDIDLDPRSRFFDPYDPDRPPMPLDDPASHQYMHVVDGIKGWKHWGLNGFRDDIENPGWRRALADYAEINEQGSLRLDIDSALRIAYINSPLNQRQLETLYLSALDVTAERFRLDSQFFGGYDARYVHNGSLIPPQLSFSPLLNRFVILPAISGPGVENNRLTVGRPLAANPALQARRQLATAGELLVGFANSFIFEFTGGDANLSASLANFTFIQPLLRGAGKDIALEALTFEERKLLANLRAYGQFRQGFYTQIAIGELGVSGPQRAGISTSLQSFSGTGSLGGYLGLLQLRQRIRNSEDNLSLQLRTLERLEALLKSEFTEIVQVDQFRQNIESQRSELLQSRNALELALDRYKTNTLGLPPDLPIELDESLVRQFQLIPREATAVQDLIVEVQRRVGTLPRAPEVEAIAVELDAAYQLIEPVRQIFQGARQDLTRLEELVPTRERTMSIQEKELFRAERERIDRLFVDLEQDFTKKVAKFEGIQATLSEQTRRETTEQLVSWISEYLQLVDRLALVPAQARLEMINVDRIDISSEKAFSVALGNRLDFMNGRAALVDRWRLVQVDADALQSVLNVTASGDLRTARNNPVSFRAPTGNFRMGLEFDAPFTRLLERNVYRESLVEYQRSRRSFIQSRDALNLGLRALLRNLEQLRLNLEIQRRAVTIAIRRVDQTQLLLTAPRPPTPPGQLPPINPTLAINLLGAQTSLRDSQNALLGAWLNYYATRLRLYRELGIMRLDPDGRWIEQPIGMDINCDSRPEFDRGGEELPLPPQIPISWIELGRATDAAVSDAAVNSENHLPDQLLRLPPTRTQ